MEMMDLQLMLDSSFLAANLALGGPGSKKPLKDYPVLLCI